MPPRAPVAALSAWALAAGGAMALSCRPPRPCPAVPSTTVQPAPRRDHCLAPPWVLDPAGPESGVPGWSAAVCKDGPGWFRDASDRARRSAYFVHGGKQRISESQIEALQKTVMADAERLGFRGSIGLGGCCSPKVAKETDAFCLKMSLNDVCILPLSRIVQAVDEALRKHELQGVRVGFDIMVDGTIGPRCEASDPACGPISSREWDWGETPRPQTGRCAIGRTAIAPPTATTPGLTCVHDGECLVGACGEKCLRWDQPLGPLTCEDIGRLEEPPVKYCGCVAGRCDWFRPAA